LYPIEQRLATEPGSVRVARRAVVDTLGGVLPPDDLDAALLATSELVTNAVEHGAGPIDLRVAPGPGTVRIEVQDGSPLLPRWRDELPDPHEVRGRGMLIVAHCAARAGVDDRADGKVVWFEIDVGGYFPNDSTPPR
jgi:anti-sigma regulatory factor (Ser/Thr protein kinase)